MFMLLIFVVVCGLFELKWICAAFYYPLANEVAKGYSNATVRPSVTSLWTL
jgi:hypothetical protein